MKKNILTICFLITISFSFYNCSTAVIEKVVIAETISYTGNVKTVITANCTTTCHNPSRLDAGLNLTTYAGLRNATENGNVITRINSAGNPMPFGGQMTPASIAIIQQWATDGYIEN